LGLATAPVSAVPPTGKGGPGGAGGSAGTNQPPRPQANPNIAFNGNTAINVVSPGGRPGQTNTKTVKSLNVKDFLAPMWNGMLTSLDKQFRDYLGDKKNTSGHRLYNINVQLAQANAGDKLFLQVDSKARRFAISYVIPGNTASFKVDTGHWYEPDPSINVKFDLSLNMSIDCNGSPPNGPLALTSATLTFSNVQVDDGVIGSIEGFLTDIFGGKDPGAQVQSAFNLAHPDVSNQLSATIGAINTLLTSFVSSPIVTPSYDTKAARFVLSLTQRAVVNPLPKKQPRPAPKKK
jgi:hypothetical protein